MEYLVEYYDDHRQRLLFHSIIEATNGKDALAKSIQQWNADNNFSVRRTPNNFSIFKKVDGEWEVLLHDKMSQLSKKEANRINEIKQLSLL